MTITENQNRRLRTKAAATYCGSTKSSFEKYRLTGEGPAYLKLGRAVVYDVKDLDEWLASKRRFSTSEKGEDESHEQEK